MAALWGCSGESQGGKTFPISAETPQLYMGIIQIGDAGEAFTGMSPAWAGCGDQLCFLLVGAAVGLCGTNPCGSGSGSSFSSQDQDFCRLLLPHPWLSRCCNPHGSARPHPVKSQRNVPVAGVETSCGHLGKSELYSLSTFLVAQARAAAEGKYSTHGPCVYPRH